MFSFCYQEEYGESEFWVLLDHVLGPYFVTHREVLNASPFSYFVTPVVIFVQPRIASPYTSGAQAAIPNTFLSMNPSLRQTLHQIATK
jgi:hypothetical protein